MKSREIRLKVGRSVRSKLEPHYGPVPTFPSRGFSPYTSALVSCFSGDSSECQEWLSSGSFSTAFPGSQRPCCHGSPQNAAGFNWKPVLPQYRKIITDSNLMTRKHILKKNSDVLGSIRLEESNSSSWSM